MGICFDMPVQPLVNIHRLYQKVDVTASKMSTTSAAEVTTFGYSSVPGESSTINTEAVTTTEQANEMSEMSTAAAKLTTFGNVDDSTTISAKTDTTAVDKISGMSTTVEVPTSSYPGDKTTTTGSVLSEQDEDQSS